MDGTPNLDQILGLARGYARVDSRTGRTEEVSGYQGRSFLGMGTARRAFESANSAISRDEMLSGRHHADRAAVHLKANHTAPDWLSAHSNVMRAAQAIQDHPFMRAHEGVRTHLAGLRQAVRDKDLAGFKHHNSALERHVAGFRSIAGVSFAAGDDEYDEPEDTELPDGDPEDWDEDDWGDVRAHLAKESPWFSQVMAGEDPGNPSAAPEGWQDRAKEILTVGMTDRTAEASTVHEPTVGPGGPGLFHIKGRQLPPYVQHLYKHLVAKYGKHRAYGVAIGIVKKWAAGVNPGGKGKGHKVHADVQAAAGKNIAEWEKDKADAHSRGGSDKHETKTTNVIGLAHGYDRVEHGRSQHVRAYYGHRLMEHLRSVHGVQEDIGDSPEWHKEIHVQDHEDMIATGHPSHHHTPDEDRAWMPIARVRPGSLAHLQSGARISDKHLHPLTATPNLDQIIGLGGAPAAWPSGRPYQESFLPKPGGGPGSGKTELKQGYPTNTGVITTSPGTQPIVYGHLRQAPSQTVSAGPPLPPGVKLPDPKEFEALASKISDGPDRQLAESARSHLQAAADKFRTGDRQGPLTMLRIVQTDLHSLYRKVVAANRPHEAQVFSERGFAGSVPPAAQSSARAEMFASREQMLEYRTQVTQVARWIDVFRRSYFHGQYQGVAEGRFTAGDLDKVLALAEVRAYDRVEHGRLEHVGEHQAWLGSLDYRLDRDPDDYHHELTAHLPGSGTKVGAIDWYGRNGDMWSEPGDPRIARTVNGLTVHSDFQRRGLATELWRRASSVQPGLAHSEGLSPEGAAWKESLGHGVSTPEEFHAKYLPKYQVRLDYLKAEADRISRLALDPSSPGWAKAEKAALDAHAKYDAAVKAAVAKTVARNKLGLTADTVATPAGPKKGQASVHYRDGSGTKDCGSCSMVRIMPPDFETLTCTAVKGPIREDGVCDIWAPSPEDGALHKLTDAQVENALLALTTVDPYKRVVAGKMQIVRSYDRKQGRFVDVLGHRHWGWYGGAGILPVHVDEHDTIRYGLQKRAGGVQHSGSYSTAGGAIDKLPSGEIETPVQAALREAEEEFGKIPEGEVTKVYTDQHGISGEPGSWAYHTVHVKYPEMFKPDAKASHASESGGIKWVTAEEMGKLPLHPDFRTYAEAHLGVQADPAKQPKDYTIAQEAPPDQDFRKDDVIEYHHKGNGVDAVIKAKVMLEPDKKHPTYLVQPALWYEKDGKPFKQVELKRQHILTAPPGHPPKTGGELKTGPVDMPPPREPGEVRTGDEVKWTGEDGKERAGRVTYVHSEGSVDVAPPPPPPPTFGKGKFKTGDRVAHRDKEGNIKAGVVTGAEDTKDKWGPFTAYHVKYDDGSEGDHAADRLVNEKYAKSLKAGGHSSGGSTSYFKAKVTGGGSYGLGTQTGFKPSASAPMPGTLAQGDKVTFYDPNEDLDRSGTVTEADSEGRIIITSDNGDRYSVSPVEYHDVHLQRVIPPKAKAPKGSMSPTTGGKAKPKFSEGDTVKRRSFTANDWDHGRITAANVAVSALGYPVHQVEFDHGTANVPESMLKKA